MKDIKEFLTKQLCPNDQWQLSTAMERVLRRQINRLPKDCVSDQEARYPTTPAGMRVFLQKFFVRHYLQIQDSLLDFITSEESVNILQGGKLQILDVGSGPAVASLAITDLLLSVLDILYSQSKFLWHSQIDITYILNDPENICLGTGKQMLNGYLSGNQNTKRHFNERIITVEKPFPDNIGQLSRISNNIGEYNIVCMSYVIIPMYEDKGIPLITKGVNSLIPCCNSENRILITQDRFREMLIRRVAKELHVRCEKSNITQKVYDQENKNNVYTYTYYRSLFHTREIEKGMNRVAG